MILHLVLFTPRPDLGADEQDRLAAALDHALTAIPSIVSYRVGRRIRIGAAYDALPGGFDFCGVMEFADIDGLAAYLSHPAHVELGQLFYTTSVNACALDFEAVASSPAVALRAWTQPRRA